MSTEQTAPHISAVSGPQAASAQAAPHIASAGLPIGFHHISMAFNGEEVLHDINLREEVTTLAIIGPSGGGKSTLLRILGGLLLPTAGYVEVDGERVPSRESELLAYRKNIGFVFQDGGLFHHMTALQNVAVPLQVVHGFSEEGAQERACALLERLGIADARSKRPAQLSGGQKQRVAIARALAPSPELLLLDEPTSALDPEFTTEVLDAIRDLKQSGTRFIIVTHEMGFARHVCDDAAFLYDGRLLEHASSEQIFNDPATPELKRFLSHILEWSM